MNRAERRRAERMKRRSRDGFQRFHQAGRGVFEAYIFRAADVLELFAFAAGGDATAQTFATLIATWLRESAKREKTSPETKFLCLDCPAEFGPNTGAPAAFSIAKPFAAAQGPAIVTGICEACTNRGEDLHAMALRRLREIWPDAYSVERGPTQ